MEKHTQSVSTRIPLNPDVGGSDFVSSPGVLRTYKDLFVKQVFYTNENETYQGHGQKISRTVINGATTTTFVALKDYLLAVTSLSGVVGIVLPRPSNAGTGKLYVVKDEVGGAATTTITVVSQGEELIDGATSSTITTNYGAKAFYTDGANWFTY